MIFTKVPEPLIGQALFYAANHPWLNPPKYIAPFGKGYKTYGFLDKLIRYTTRLFFIMGAGVVCPILGTIRHSIYAHRYWALSIRSEGERKLEDRALAKLHLQAARIDLQGIFCILIAPKYAWSLDENIEIWFNSTDVYVPETQQGNSNTVKDYPWEIFADDGVCQNVQNYKNQYLAAYVNRLVKINKTSVKDSGLKRYRILGQSYPYNQLKKFSLDLRMLTGYEVAINHSEVLRGVRIEMWNEPQEESSFCPEIPAPDYLKFKTRNDPFYSIPWKSIALAVSALVVCFFIGISLYADYLTNYLGESILAISRKNYILAGLPIAFLRLARKLEIEQRDKEQKIIDEEINKGNLGNGIAWYGKAAMDGYAPAQRIYGLALLLCLKKNKVEEINDKEVEELDEGLKWLYASAKNGDKGALEDCRLLMGGSFPEYHLFKGKKKERLMALIGKRNIYEIAQNRFMEKLNISIQYKSFVTVFVNSMVKKKNKKLFSHPLS